jgi:protein TonB
MQATTENWRGRAGRLTLAVFVHVIAIILAYVLSPPIIFKKPSPDLQVFTLPSPTKTKSAAKHAARTKDQHPKITPEQPKPPAQQVDTTPLNMMYVSSDVFRASDISKIHSTPNTSAPAAMADADESVGVGPDGARLYDAEWYRLPTDAEIDPYLPKNAHSGYGMIICKTAAEYHVEDCRELDEEPMGSGLARSMRLASWQFRVRPKRLGGRSLIGTWVRIRFDLHEVVRK